jgi:hypothetical protein
MTSTLSRLALITILLSFLLFLNTASSQRLTANGGNDGDSLKEKTPTGVNNNNENNNIVGNSIGNNNGIVTERSPTGKRGGNLVEEPSQSAPLKPTTSSTSKSGSEKLVATPEPKSEEKPETSSNTASSSFNKDNSNTSYIIAGSAIGCCILVGVVMSVVLRTRRR